MASRASRSASGGGRFTGRLGRASCIIILDLIKDSPCAWPHVGCQYAGCRRDQAVARVVLLYKSGLDPLRYVRSIGMGHPEAYHLWTRREPLVQQAQHPGLHVLSSPDPLDRHHMAVTVEGEDWFHVEHPCQ